MLTPLITFGGILFWLLTLVAFVASVGSMSSQKIGRTVLVLMGYLALVVLFTNADPMSWVKTNWLLCLYGAGAYLAAGVVYMIIRWQIFSSKVATLYSQIRDSFLAKSDNANILQTPKGKEELLEAVRRDYKMTDLGGSVPLLVRRNKARLSTWIIFWPISATEYLLGDLLTDVINGIVQAFSGMMQRMTDRKFSKFNELS